MRYCLLVAAFVLALSACQQKKVISPARYASTQPQTVRQVTQPPAPTESGTITEQNVPEAPAPKVAPAAPPAPSPEAPRPGREAAQEEVTYQIGAFTKRENAQALAERVGASGFTTVIEDEATEGAPQHRVLATYKGRDAEARERLLQLGVYDPILLGGRVDPGSGKEPRPNAEQSQPPQPAYAPQSGVSYQVGAFAKEENARQLQRQLEEDGFTVQVQPTQGVPAQYRVIATWPGTDEEGRARLLEHDVFAPIIVHAAPQAAAQAEETPPPASSAPPAQGAGTFRFQVGAFSSIENAEVLRGKLEAKGFKSEIELIEEQGRPKYRVLAIKQGNVPELRQELMAIGVQQPILLGY